MLSRVTIVALALAGLLRLAGGFQAQERRIQVGADADITVLDPLRIADQSTFEQPARPSVGVKAVLVNGVAVV